LFDICQNTKENATKLFVTEKVRSTREVMHYITYYVTFLLSTDDQDAPLATPTCPNDPQSHTALHTISINDWKKNLRKKTLFFSKPKSKALLLSSLQWKKHRSGHHQPFPVWIQKCSRFLPSTLLTNEGISVNVALYYSSFISGRQDGARH
jgi:hypothetical protein